MVFALQPDAIIRPSPEIARPETAPLCSRADLIAPVGHRHVPKPDVLVPAAAGKFTAIGRKRDGKDGVMMPFVNAEDFSGVDCHQLNSPRLVTQGSGSSIRRKIHGGDLAQALIRRHRLKCARTEIPPMRQATGVRDQQSLARPGERHRITHSGSRYLSLIVATSHTRTLLSLQPAAMSFPSDEKVKLPIFSEFRFVIVVGD
jgi:hypothetical protein